MSINEEGNFRRSNPRPSGMAGFTIVWFGQIVSVLATNMTAFAQSIWVYQETGSVTALGLVQVCFIVPFLILSPIAGVMVDRYNRKLMMMISDAVAVLPTAGLLILSATGRLEVWHLYVAAAFQGIGNTFQWPAYSAAIIDHGPEGAARPGQRHDDPHRSRPGRVRADLRGRSLARHRPDRHPRHRCHDVLHRDPGARCRVHPAAGQDRRGPRSAREHAQRGDVRFLATSSNAPACWACNCSSSWATSSGGSQ